MRPPQAYCRSIPNAITATRFLFALALLFVSPGSVPFWLCYGGGAASDVLDGWLARRFHWESDTGAKWDSLADVAFLIALLMVGLRHRWFPVWRSGGRWGWPSSVGLPTPSAGRDSTPSPPSTPGSTSWPV